MPSKKYSTVQYPTMPVPKKVRFAYENAYYSPRPLKAPGLSHTVSTAPSSRGPITPPNVVYPLPHHPHMPVMKAPTYPPRVKPHRYLAPEAVLWNLVDHPSTSIRNHGPLSSRALLEPASEPPLPFIHITSQHLPWSCKVHASNRQFVTVGDVLESLYRLLRINITQTDFQNMFEKERRRASRAYEERYRRLPRGRGYEEEKRGGMKRVDFLMGHTRFGGLSIEPHQPQEWHLRVT